MTVYITNLASHEPLPEGFTNLLEEMAQSILEQHGLGSGELGLILTDDAHLRKLNCSYRGLDSSTDVLSFSMLDRPGEGLWLNGGAS